MKKSFIHLLIIILILLPLVLQATQPTFNMTIQDFVRFPNSTTGADSILQFDVFIQWTNSADPTCDPFEYGMAQLAITFNPDLINGTLSASRVYINGGINIPSVMQNPVPFQITGNLFRAAGSISNPENDFIISDQFPGNRMLRVKLRTTAHTFPCVPPDLRFALSSPGRTAVSYYAPGKPQENVILLDTVQNIYSTQYLPFPYNFFCSFPHGSLINRFSLSLSSLIQGFYRPDQYKMVRDTMSVFLRNSTTPFAIIDSSKSYLDSLGFGDYNFTTVSNSTQYYIVLKHRNSIETWSSITKNFVGEHMAYDFTNAQSQAYGSNQVLIDPVTILYSIYSGDINNDNTVNLLDITNVYNDVAIFNSGYVKMDVTGDDLVNLSDLILTYNNAANYVAIVRP